MRFVDLASFGSDDVRAAYDRKLAAIVDMDDRNMEMYRTRVRAFYEQSIEGTRLLEHLFSTGVHAALAARDELTLTAQQMLQGFQRWVANTTHTQYQTLLAHLGHDASRYFQSMAALCSRQSRKRTAFLTAVLDACFGLELVDYRPGEERSLRRQEGRRQQVVRPHRRVQTHFDAAAHPGRTFALCSGRFRRRWCLYLVVRLYVTQKVRAVARDSTASSAPLKIGVKAIPSNTLCLREQALLPRSGLRSPAPLPRSHFQDYPVAQRATRRPLAVTAPVARATRGNLIDGRREAGGAPVVDDR
jgi:hypothetical protein